MLRAAIVSNYRTGVSNARDSEVIRCAIVYKSRVPRRFGGRVGRGGTGTVGLACGSSRCLCVTRNFNAGRANNCDVAIGRFCIGSGTVCFSAHLVTPSGNRGIDGRTDCPCVMVGARLDRVPIIFR